MHLKSNVKSERNFKKNDYNYLGNIRRNRYMSFVYTYGRCFNVNVTLHIIRSKRELQNEKLLSTVGFGPITLRLEVLPTLSTALAGICLKVMFESHLYKFILYIEISSTSGQIW